MKNGTNDLKINRMQVQKIWFDKQYIFVETNENKIGKMPLNWFPNLLNATENQLQQYELWANNTWIHWENLKEDLSVDGFFSFNGLNQNN